MTAAVIRLHRSKRQTPGEQSMSALLRRLADDADRGRIVGVSVITTTCDGRVETFSDRLPPTLPRV